MVRIRSYRMPCSLPEAQRTMTRKRVLRVAERVLQLRGLTITHKWASVDGLDICEYYEIASTRDSRVWQTVETHGPNTYDGIGFELTINKDGTSA